MRDPASTGTTTFEKPNDTDLVVTRVFRAPRQLVFDAHTKPVHIREWMLGPPGRVATTERWGLEWPETVNTLVFTEAGGFTTLTMTITYPSGKAREAALGTGMTSGMDQSYARLDELLAILA